MRQTREFDGTEYIIECEEHPGYQHPSWFSFDDEKDVRARDWRIRPGDVVLDVGAAYGSYTLTALVSGAAFVYSWSPQGPEGQPSEAEYLRRSLAANEWQTRCVVIEGGCYDRSGWLNASTQEFSEEKPEGDKMNNDVIRVDKLDDFFASSGMEHCEWMKLDVEGAEVEVLKGAEKLIRALKPTILVENHLFKRNTIAEEVRSLLGDMGYRHISTHQYHSVSHSVYRAKSS